MFSGETTIEPTARYGGPEERGSDKYSDSWVLADRIVPNVIDASPLAFHPPSPGCPDWLLAQGWSYPDTAARLFPNLTGFHVIESPRQSRDRAAGSYVKEQNCYDDEKRSFRVPGQAAPIPARVTAAIVRFALEIRPTPAAALGPSRRDPSSRTESRPRNAIKSRSVRGGNAPDCMQRRQSAGAPRLGGP